MIRVVLADDHPIVLNGLAQILRAEPDFTVTARCTDGEAAIDTVRKHAPDLLVIDLRMPRRDGLSVLREVKMLHASVRVILLTAALTRREAEEAIHAGVDGIILKESALNVLLDAARAVSRGEKWLHMAELERLLNSPAEGAANGDSSLQLTHRERQIIALKRQGSSIEQIAARLGLAEGALRVHLERIRQKENRGVERLMVDVPERRALSSTSDADLATGRVVRLQRRFGLTPREAAVAALLADGLSNKEIAERLQITINTVKTHVAAIHSKTEVSSTRKLLVLLRSD